MFFNEKDFKAFVFAVVFFGVVLGVAGAYLIPMAWDFIKPIIHEVTK